MSVAIMRPDSRPAFRPAKQVQPLGTFIPVEFAGQGTADIKNMLAQETYVSSLINDHV